MPCFTANAQPFLAIKILGYFFETSDFCDPEIGVVAFLFHDLNGVPYCHLKHLSGEWKSSLPPKNSMDFTMFQVANLINMPITSHRSEEPSSYLRNRWIPKIKKIRRFCSASFQIICSTRVSMQVSNSLVSWFTNFINYFFWTYNLLIWGL